MHIAEQTVSKIWGLLTGEYIQYSAFAVLTLLVSLFAIKAYADAPEAFQRYLGRIHPLIVLTGLFLIGLALFSLLMKAGDFAVYRIGEYTGILVAAGLAVPLAAVAIFVDTKVPFPQDMNVAFPTSIFFYPAIGYVVELAFHLVPFSLIYLLLGRLFNGADGNWIVWVSILGAAVIEPIFQVVYATGESRGVVVFVGVHLLVINLVQLILFARYDFYSMYAFRLSYYLFWHILWGYARLRILF